MAYSEREALMRTFTADVLAALRRATAYHEAGHVVIGLSCGIGIQYVTIKPEGKLWGHVQRTGRRTRPYIGDATREAFVCEVAYLLAGSLAEERFTGRNLRTPGDYSKVDQIVVAYIGADKAAALTAQMEAVVRGMIEPPPVWSMIDRVAVALMERETLTGDDLGRIISGDAQVGPPQV
jgi:ATP-dependent Zn protease